MADGGFTQYKTGMQIHTARQQSQRTLGCTGHIQVQESNTSVQNVDGSRVSKYSVTYGNLEAGRPHPVCSHSRNCHCLEGQRPDNWDLSLKTLKYLIWDTKNTQCVSSCVSTEAASPELLYQRSTTKLHSPEHEHNSGSISDSTWDIFKLSLSLTPPAPPLSNSSLKDRNQTDTLSRPHLHTKSCDIL